MAGPSREIDAIAFDLGGVLIDWDPRYVYRELFADLAGMEEFLASVCTGMRRHGLRPERTVFIDDQARNIAAAGELGLIGLPFSSPAQLRADLRDLGLYT